MPQRKIINSDKNRKINFSLVISILALCLSVFSAGYNIYYDRPRLNGGVQQVMKMHLLNPTTGLDVTQFIVYLEINNSGKIPIELNDYKLEVDYGEGYNILKRVYGVDNLADSINFLIGMNTKIPNLKSQLIYSNGQIIQPGSSIKGFIIFWGDSSFNLKWTKRYKLKCVDVNKNEYVLITKFEDLMNTYLFQEKTGINISPLDEWRKSQ